eukprot:g9458.t1
MARSPAPVTSYQALRAKLNGLSYVQPFVAQESLALVERLLEDLLKSAESYRLLQRAVAEREKQTQEVVKELEALHQEQPQLWRENVELHRRWAPCASGGVRIDMAGWTWACQIGEETCGKLVS